MRVFSTLILPLLFFALAGCSEGGPKFKETFIKSRFQSEFPKRYRNLKDKFGDEILIKRGKDTLKVEFKFEKKSKINHIVINNDTVFSGTVTKYKKKYYLSREIKDSTFFIHAISIKKDLIKGLGYEVEQMLLVDDFFNQKLYKDPLKRKCVPLIKHKDSTCVILKTDKKLVGSLFNFILNEIRPDTLIRQQQVMDSVSVIKLLTDTVKSNLEPTYQVYSNPLDREVIVKCKQQKKCRCIITDTGGKVVYTSQLQNEVNNITVNGVAGFYIVSIYNSGNEKIQSSKVYIGK